MGNKSSQEMWQGVYDLQEKDTLAFDDELTNKVQMGELDMMDEKAVEQFKSQWQANIQSDRNNILNGFWEHYSNKSAMGVNEVRSFLQDAVKYGKLYLPKVLVAQAEVVAMKQVATQVNRLMSDREARPMFEESLASVRRDVADRIRNQLNEVDANFMGDCFLLRAVGEFKGVELSPVELAPEQKKKLNSKLTINKEQFLACYSDAMPFAMRLTDLTESVQAQFSSFVEIEVRNIPERVIRKLEGEGDPESPEGPDDSERDIEDA